MSTIPPDHQTSTVPHPSMTPFNERQPPTIRLYPLSNYTFGVKETQPEEDPSVKDRLRRLEEYYEQYGMRRTCEGVLVCHEHNHPHVLMLQIANAFFKLYDPAFACQVARWADVSTPDPATISPMTPPKSPHSKPA